MRGLSTQKVKQDLLARSRWHHDIESQVDLFNHSAHELLTVSCPNDVQQAKKPFFDQKLWELRGKKLSSRRNVKKISGRNRREILAYVFLTWKQLHTAEENIDQPAAWNYRSSVLTWLLKATAGLYSNNRQLRQAVTESKDRFVRSHIDSLQPNASASEILHGLRPVVGSSNQRKRKGTSLPLVLDAEGKHCRSTKEATDRWIEFFGAMEGGTRLTEQQQRDLWRKGLADAIAMETDIPLSKSQPFSTWNARTDMCARTKPLDTITFQESCATTSQHRSRRPPMDSYCTYSYMAKRHSYTKEGNW